MAPPLAPRWAQTRQRKQRRAFFRLASLVAMAPRPSILAKTTWKTVREPPYEVVLNGHGGNDFRQILGEP